MQLAEGAAAVPEGGAPRAAARPRRRRLAGLRLVRASELSLGRRRCGSGFVYLAAGGGRIADPAVIARIRALAIPPAYREVRIAAEDDAHLQAVGRDDRGRWQFRYHPLWEAQREARKVERLARLVEALPRLRRRVARDLARPGLPRERVLAAVVQLIDRTHIRIGGEDYVHSGRSRGAATLLKSQLASQGRVLRFAFRGKGGRRIEGSVAAPALARLLPELLALPGPRLFQYLDADGRRRRVNAREVNLYLQEIAGTPVSAKDFRTLAASANAARRLAAQEPGATATARRRQLAEVMREIALLLSNTPAVVRKSYVHGCVVEAFEAGALPRLFAGRALPCLNGAESAVSRLLHE